MKQRVFAAAGLSGVKGDSRRRQINSGTWETRRGERCGGCPDGSTGDGKP
ncbi:hypothetical protein [Gimesia maris]